MATADEIAKAIDCLANVYPQMVANDLSEAIDTITSLIQSVRDPLQTLKDIDVGQLLEKTDLDGGDEIWDNVAVVAAGLTSQFARREIDATVDALEEATIGDKRVDAVINLSNRVVNRVSILLGFTPDMPYAAAQRTCELIISTADLKIANLECLQKHIYQLVNAIMVLVKNVNSFKGRVLDDLALAKSELERTSTELNRSQRLVDGSVRLDRKAIDRAQGALRNVNAVFSPPRTTDSILDFARILSLGDVGVDLINEENQALMRTVIPSLANLVEQGAVAYEQQVRTINRLIESLSEVTAQYQQSADTGRLREQRSRAIETVKARVDDLCQRVASAISRQSITGAATEMLSWISRVKAAITMLDEIKNLDYEIGSIEGDDKAEELRVALEDLTRELTLLENELTAAGLEDPALLKGQLVTLAQGARRVLADFDAGRATEASLVVVHTIATAVADEQIGRIEGSIDIAQRQQRFCLSFSSIEMAARVLFDQSVDMLAEVGLDLGVDLFRAGQFAEFLSRDSNLLTYAGAGINCLTEALAGISDSQTRQRVIEIRDKLVARQVTKQYAAADSADFNLRTQIETAQAKVAEIQRDAKQVEAIVSQLQELFDSLGAVQSPTDSFNTFALNLKRLAVGAGGRLASSLERYSGHPNAGVVDC